MKLKSVLLTGLSLLMITGECAIPAFAQAPAIRPIPPVGIEIPQQKLTELRDGLKKLDEKIANLQRRRDLRTARLLPDIQIFSEAVRKALEESGFYTPEDPNRAQSLLNEGMARADELMNGKHSWTSKSGLVVRGYRSKLDDSIQPYGLVIGEKWNPDSTQPVRCDIWFRGRSEKGLELQFLADRMKNKGEYQLSDGIVLHPLGRYCNANRFAGEVDVFEALADVKENYHIDPDRISVRGFSMGGAAAWGFTVHYPGLWFASNPGAGFSETRQFRGLDKKPEQLPSKIEQQLWTMYDADVLADNLFNLPVVAYSGEIDGQKKAADIMVAAAEKRGIKFPYVIGPQTGHKIHPDSKLEIAAQMDEWAKEGRQKKRQTVRFSTFTLKYNQCGWVTLNGLEEHWQEAYVDGEVVSAGPSSSKLVLKTRNVNDFTVDFTQDAQRFTRQPQIEVTIDGQQLAPVAVAAEGLVQSRFHKKNGQWNAAALNAPLHTGLVKKHQLQGPIDDALMDSFLFVEPTGKFANPAVQKWVESELQRAKREWSRQMRGTVRVKKDSEVTDEDIKNHNLILWGTPESNQMISRLNSKLPIIWTDKEISVGKQKFDAAGNSLILCYPNPLNPDRYQVLNSSFTYREADYLNNSMQTPKLPDWAIIDLSQPPSETAPGKIVAADFFNERWQLKAAD